MVNQLKSKLQIEREKHKKVTDKMKQNFDSILASTKQSFSEEIEKLQSMLADSSNQCSSLAEKLEIAEEIMDDGYTNWLNQKVIYATRLKKLEDMAKANATLANSILYDKLKLENDQYLMVIEDLTGRVEILTRDKQSLKQQLEAAQVSLQRNQPCRKNLGLYLS